MQILMPPSTDNLLSIKFAYCDISKFYGHILRTFCLLFLTAVESMKGTIMHMALLWPQPHVILFMIVAS